MKRFLMACALVLGCGPRTLAPSGEVVVHIATDAILPMPPGVPPRGVAPLFDRIRISVYEPGASTPCAGCVNEFAVDDAMAGVGAISFGVTPAVGASGYRAKIDLFRAVAVAQGEPIALATVTHVVALPAITAEGIIDIGVFVSVDEVGQPVGSLDAPEGASVGLPDQTRTGTWSGARSIPCTGSPESGEVCVPGGAYWMGNPNLLFLPENNADNAAVPHLVVLSPFFIDSTEVTVSTFRATGVPTAGAGKSIDPVEAPNPLDVTDSRHYCTYTAAAGPNDKLALNCVSWTKARQFCQARGADLVTEAQYEYIAGALGSHLYPWGEDTPACGDVVFDLRDSNYTTGLASAVCNLKDVTTRPESPGNGARDRVQLAAGTVYDLAGNVGEWAADKWNRASEPCWAVPLLTDPICTSVSPADGDAVAGRGGSWASALNRIQIAQRVYQVPDTAAATGFRCARSAR